MIACWIALENINKSAGRFFVFPKSHKLDISKITSSQIKNHYDYAKLIMSFMEKEGIKRYV